MNEPDICTTAPEELAHWYGSAPLGLCFVDAELRYVRINDQLAAINGRPAAEHIGRTIREVAPRIADVVEPIYRKILETGEAVLDHEMRGTTEATPRTGRPYVVSFFPVVRDERVVGVNTMVQDASEREEMQRELRRGAQILRQVHDAVISTDMEGVIQTWNGAACRIYGYAADEAVGRHVDFLYFPEDLPALRGQGIRAVLQRGSHETRLRNRRKDGREIFIDLRLSLLHDESGRPVGLIGCSNDVTERTRLQRELLAATTREQRRIGQELHDVTGQELTGLRYLTRSLVRALKRTGSDQVELASKIEDGLGRALDQVRELSRGLVPVEVDAEGLMASLSDLARRAGEIDGTSCTFVCDEPTPVRDNQMATQLYRIALEGVSNATKHARAERIRIELERRGGVLRLSVVDNGAGLPAEPGPGGLGLRIMAFRADLIGGALRVDAAPGGGTEVTCTVPVRP